jgi:DNA-binding NarL/FixJ family response regulator
VLFLFLLAPRVAAAQTPQIKPTKRVLVFNEFGGHSSVTERVSALLQPNFEVVGTVTNGKELLFESARLLPDLIVLDISIPELSGIEAAHELRSLGSTAKIVFLTVQTRVEFVRACLTEGASGYVTKSRLATDLIPAIQDALSGHRFVSPPVSR